MLSLFCVSCSEEATRQLVSEAALESLVAMATHTDSTDTVNTASYLLLSVASNAPSLRQYLGRSGAIEYFVHNLEEEVTCDGTLTHKYHMLNALCQCCRDANNRIKIREQGGLSVLTNVLSDDQLTRIHDRVISALVCFIYDDASITVLQSLLVPTLISHLYRVSGIVKKSDFTGLDCHFKIIDSLRTDLTEISHSDLDYLDDADISGDDRSRSFPADTEIIKDNDLANCAGSSAVSTGNDNRDDIVEKPSFATDALQSDELNIDRSKGALELVDEPIDTETNTVEVGVKTHRYSMNSPTYKAVSAWRMELDEDRDSSCDRRSPRNIWEGARMYAENISTLSPPPASRAGSVSPARSLGSCSDSLCNVRSWSLSLCESSPRKSPSLSPTWSLDSSSSGVYSPYSNSSYVYPCGSCSPSSFSDVGEESPPVFSTHDCSDRQFEATAEISMSDDHHVECSSCLPTRYLSGGEDAVEKAHSDVNMSKIDTDDCILDLPAYTTVLSDVTIQNDDVGRSVEFSLSIAESDHNEPVAEIKSGDANEDELREGCSDDEFDIESFQRERQAERKFSRLIDIAQSMYACVETEGVSRPRQTRKRRRSSSSTGQAASTRQKTESTTVSGKTENIFSTTDGTGNVGDLQTASDDSAQCRLVSDDTSTGEVNSDSESDVSSTCDLHHRNISRVTEQNILTLLSRFSHSPESIAYVMNAGTICGLLDYALLASSPLPAAGRTLLRLSRSHHGFQRAVICLFPLQVAWRMEQDWRACRNEASESGGVDSQHFSHCASTVHSSNCSCQLANSSSLTRPEFISKNKPIDRCDCALSIQEESSIVKADCVKQVEERFVPKLCNEIIANLSTIAISAYGQGVVAHLLLRGSQRQRERCVISLCFLCRFVFYVFITYFRADNSPR